MHHLAPFMLMQISKSTMAKNDTVAAHRQGHIHYETRAVGRYTAFARIEVAGLKIEVCHPTCTQLSMLHKYVKLRYSTLNLHLLVCIVHSLVELYTPCIEVELYVWVIFSIR